MGVDAIWLQMVTALQKILHFPAWDPPAHTELRLGIASLFRYGLYDQGICTVDETLWRFGFFVHKNLPRNVGFS